ncbi:MAG: exodeoxyribonuclease VII small subunit [Bacteroidales bacterium]|nr:exodeoxyribonuclease VII small subunit [Bacteroidales bacterium]
MAKKEISYNEAVSEIEQIMKKIEEDQLNIDELSNNVKHVAGLIKLCKKKLHKTQSDIQKILDDIDIQ